MKFLGWDVGIKNLAYSLIDYNEETQTKEIIDWGIINLMAEVDAEPKHVHLCCESNKKGKKCELKAIYLLQSDETKGVCKVHQKLLKYAQFKFLDLTQKAICCYETYVKKTNITKKCEKAAFTTRKDDLTKGYCNQHLKVVQSQEPFEIYEIKKDKKELVREISILTLSKRLFQHLESLGDILLNVDEIIIENQPVLKNPTMKTIQILLYSYFVMNGILKEKVKNINFFSASKKLEAFDDVGNKIFNTLSHITNQYQINKKLSVLYTNEMVKNDIKWFKFFNTHSKKDDLADAYLTNCYFIDRQFKINKKAEKIKEKKPKSSSTSKTSKKTDDVDDVDFIDENNISIMIDDDNNDEIPEEIEITMDDNLENDLDLNCLNDLEDDESENKNDNKNKSKPRKFMKFKQYAKKPKTPLTSSTPKSASKSASSNTNTNTNTQKEKIPIPKSVMATVKNKKSKLDDFF